MNKPDFLSKINLPAWRLVMMAVTAVLITISWMVFPPENPVHKFQVIPLYVSLVVMLLQSMANRYGQLMGALNSILYAAVYFFVFKTYGQAAYALFASFPFQLAAFINWSRNTKDGETRFKRLSAKALALIVLGFGVLWLALYIILGLLGSEYVVFDNTLTLLGTLCSVLVVFAYIEYTYFSLISSFFGLWQYITMIFIDGEYSRMPHFVYSIYATVCVVLALIKMNEIYKKQKGETV